MSSQVSFASYFSKKEINLLYKFFRQLFKKPVSLVGSGRDAIFVILKTIEGKSGNGEVILPNYSCPSIPKTVIKAGFEPVFVDVDMQMHSSIDQVEAAINSNTKAALFYHPKGTLVNPTLFELSKRKNILSIEDSAQHIPGVAGNYGDFSLFSFRTQKPISAGSGGLIVFNNVNYPPIIRLRKYPLINTIINLVDFRIQRKKYIPKIKSAIDSFFEPIGPYSIGNAESKIVLNCIKTICKDIESHKFIFNSLSENISDIKNIRVIKFDITNSKPDFFSFLVNSSNRQQIITELRKIGLTIDTWYSHVNSDRFNEYKSFGEVNSRELANKLVNINISHIVKSQKSLDYKRIREVISI